MKGSVASDEDISEKAALGQAIRGKQAEKS